MIPSRSTYDGFSLVEVVVGAGIVALVVTAIATAWTFYEKLASQSARQAQADLLVEEGAEIVQYWRDKSWDNTIGILTTGTAYYLYWDGIDYKATTSPTTSNGYLRTIVFSDVQRDGSDNISTTGTTDTNTRLATITVTTNSTSSPAMIMQAQTLVHDMFAN
ncbi:MAG TPA: hypothetical protein VF438_03675 [Candidatus Paceibacterota bacterium]